MNTTRSSILVAEVPGYAELQREVHDALRAQHPEWIEADGKSPTCDSYELRLAELLVSHRNEEVRLIWATLTRIREVCEQSLRADVRRSRLESGRMALGVR